MLVVINEPSKNTYFTKVGSTTVEALAVNINNYDLIVIHEHQYNDKETFDKNVFSLVVHKYNGKGYLDDETGWPSNLTHYTLAIYDNYEDCVNLFKKIIEAMESGKQVFRIPTETTISVVMTQIFATLYVLKDREPYRLSEIALQVARLTGEPETECNQGGRIYYNCSANLTYWSRKGFTKNSRTDRNLPTGFHQITESGIDYLNNNPVNA